MRGAGGDRTDAGATTGDVYDAERRLVSWTAGGVTGKEAYDGGGQRVAHQTASGVTTTTTYYIGGLEEVDAASGTITKYYPIAGGLPEAVRVGSTLSYLARDGLGSVSGALDGSGNLTATALYAPYGQTRYSTGTMPTSKGYTGQRADAASGLDYYGARFYDPSLDQFASADTVADGLDRFAYVRDSPESFTDPSGHRMTDGPTIGTPPTWWDSFTQWVQNGWNAIAPVADPILHFNQAQKEGQVFQDPNASLQTRAAALGDVALIAASDAMLVDGVGEGIDVVSLACGPCWTAERTWPPTRARRPLATPWATRAGAEEAAGETSAVAAVMLGAAGETPGVVVTREGAGEMPAMEAAALAPIPRWRPPAARPRLAG